MFQTDFLTFPQCDRFTSSSTNESVPAPHAWPAYKVERDKKRKDTHTHTQSNQTRFPFGTTTRETPCCFPIPIVFPRLSVPRPLLTCAHGERVNDEHFSFALYELCYLVPFVTYLFSP